MSTSATTPIQPLLCSIADCARLLGISHKTVRNQISLNIFPLSVIRLGGRTLFRISDVANFVETGGIKTAAEVVEEKRGRGRPRKIVERRA